MRTSNVLSGPERNARGRFWVYGLVLLVTLSALFYRSFLPGVVHFNNDTPLGAVKPIADNLASAPFGRWTDLNSVGAPLPAILPDISAGVLFLVGAVGSAKFGAPLALLVLGLCAWLFFRQLGLSLLAC